MGASMRHVASFSGGKDSTAMVLRMIEEKMPLDEIVFFDTGWEFPQMAAHIDKVEAHIGRPITRLHPLQSFDYWMIERPIVCKKGDMKGKVHRLGNGWPSMSRRWCTREKVTVLDRHIGDAVRYIGIASDEAHRMASASLMGARYEKRYPLVDWDMDEAACLSYCRERGFDWGGLYDIFPRVSCYCCPLQRIDQLRKLRRHFPDLWAKMLVMEDRIERRKFGFKEWVTVHDFESRFSREDKEAALPTLFDVGAR